MPSNPPDDQLLRSYLLGELPEEEAERIEQRLMEDDESFLLCEAIEADLLAALDRGELNPTEKERVLERLAASSQGRQRLALARFLNTAADRPSGPWAIPWVFVRRAFGFLRPGMRWATMAAAVLLVTTGVWLALRNGDPAPQITQRISPPPPLADPQKPVSPPTGAPIPQGPPKGERLVRKDEPLPPPRVDRPEPTKVVLTLSLVRLRGGAEDLAEVRIPPGTDLVEIQIDLGGLEDFESFHADVRNQGTGETVWERGQLEPRQFEWGKALILEVPAQDLTSGRYEVAVTGRTKDLTEELEPEEFEVVREHR